MFLLHIALINNNPFDGVCAAVPQYIIEQSKYETIAFINISNIKIEVLENITNDIGGEKQYLQQEYKTPFNIDEMKKPFNAPDLVIFHECYRPQYLRIARQLKKKGIPYIIVPHGELRREAQNKKHFKKAIANLLLFNKFIDNAKGIQCLSLAEKDNTYFHRNKFIATNGVYIPKEHKEIFNNNRIQFIYIGRYEWYVKGLDLLFRAIKLIKDTLVQHNCHFDLYGPDKLGRFRDITKMVIDNGISDLVTLHLEITGKKKSKALLDADVFIQTSRHEGMPMGILEALSLGIPCLVTKGTTLAEAIESADAGWDAGISPEDISEALKRVIKEKDNWGVYSNNAIEFAKNNYSWEEVTKSTLHKYKNIIEL